MRYYLLTLILAVIGGQFSMAQNSAVYYDLFPEADDPVSNGYTAKDDHNDYLLYVPLSAYSNTFSSLSDFNFSFVRHVRRGYEHRMRRVSVDGIDLSDPLEASVRWNLLSPLNDATRDVRRGYGLSPSAAGVGSVGGTDYYNLSAGFRTPYRRVSLMLTDRRFRAGARLSVAEPWSERSPWAYSVSGAFRAGRDGHINGIFTDEWNLTASIARRINSAHHVSFSMMVAPSERGVRGAAVREAFDLCGTMYNPYWGYQDGRMRSSRVRTEFQPMAIVSWGYSPDERLNVNAAVSYTFGRSVYSSLDWYDAPNPTPDYYRYMPSWYNDPFLSERVYDEWSSRNPDFTQINWNELYNINRNEGGMNTASYILGGDVRDMNSIQAVANVSYDINSLLQFRGGVRLRQDSENRYRRVEDMLGAEYLLDIDQYLIDDELYGDKILNDVRNPNRIIRRGDAFRYNYDLNYSSYGGWAVLEIGRRQGSGLTSGYVALDASKVAVWRYGNYEKELFAGKASFGESEKAFITEFMLKGGVRHIFNPSNVITADIAYGAMAPSARELFIEPDFRNALAATSRPIDVMSGEINYRFSRPVFDITFTAYATATKGQTDVRSFYDDVSKEYLNGVISGINKFYSGAELGVTVDITSRLSFRSAAAKSYNVYLNDPSADMYSDRSGQLIVDDHDVYIKGYRLSGSPQTTLTGELRYSGERMFNFSLAVNYAAENYISMNPMRRMQRVFDYVTAPELLDRIVGQERFSDATTINVFASKTFAIRGGSYLTFSCSVNNIANSRNIIYSGYEQMRLASSGIGVDRSFSPFASKYYYAYGRTYYLTVSYKF